VVDVMRPAFNLEPKYRVTTLTKEEFARGTGTSAVEKGLSCLQMGPGRRKGPGMESMGNLWEEYTVFL
jgi:hypothetical protein